MLVFYFCLSWLVQKLSYLFIGWCSSFVGMMAGNPEPVNVTIMLIS